MSMTESRRTESPSTEVRAPATDSFREQVARETKPSFMTTEFWAMLVGIVALVVIYNTSDEPSLDLFRTSLLATLIAVGYMVSRGFAKSGSRRTRVEETDRRY